MLSHIIRSKSETTKVAVLLSGCGVFDGSEIHESTSILIHLARLGVEYQCFSQNKSFIATNHTTGQPHEAQRNMMEESARISRGAIKPVTQLDVGSFNALFIPGGFGIAKNFSNYAEKGQDMQVDPEISEVILAFYNTVKPIGASCIAPIILAKILGTTSGKKGIDLTLGKKGSDWPYADSIEVANKFGNKAVNCDIDDICRDGFSKIVTTPAYMKDTANPYEVYQSIGKMVDEVIKLVKN